VTSNRDGEFVMVGMLNGVNAFDPFAPFPPSETSDGTVLKDLPLTQTSNWTHVTFDTTLSQKYDALVVGLIMGGTTGFRAVDNVTLNTVPEPSSMLLLGAGLIGFFGPVRKKFKK